MVDFIF